MDDKQDRTAAVSRALAVQRAQTEAVTVTAVDEQPRPPISTSRQVLSQLSHNHAYSDYKHVLANILRSLSVAGTPPVEARSPGRRRINVENAPVARRSPAGDARRPRPAGRSPYVVISRDGRKLVARVRVMLP